MKFYVNKDVMNEAIMIVNAVYRSKTDDAKSILEVVALARQAADVTAEIMKVVHNNKDNEIIELECMDEIEERIKELYDEMDKED